MADQTVLFEDVKDQLDTLYVANARLRRSTYHLVAESDQAYRAVKARAWSIANAVRSVVKVGLDTIGCLPPIEGLLPGQLIGEQSRFTGKDVSDNDIIAAGMILRVARQAHEASDASYEAYTALVANRTVGNDVRQPDQPEVGPEFVRHLLGWQENLDATVEVEKLILARLDELSQRDAEAAEVGNALAKAARCFIEGMEQDLKVARGEPKEEPAPVPAPTGDTLRDLSRLGRRLWGAALVNLTELSMCSTSTGTRAGFLRSVEDEYTLAHEVLSLLLIELMRHQPPVEEPKGETVPAVVPAEEPKAAETLPAVVPVEEPKAEGDVAQ